MLNQGEMNNFITTLIVLCLCVSCKKSVNNTDFNIIPIDTLYGYNSIFDQTALDTFFKGKKIIRFNPEMYMEVKYFQNDNIYEDNYYIFKKSEHVYLAYIYILYNKKNQNITLREFKKNHTLSFEYLFTHELDFFNNGNYFVCNNQYCFEVNENGVNIFDNNLDLITSVGLKYNPRESPSFYKNLEIYKDRYLILLQYLVVKNYPNYINRMYIIDLNNYELIKTCDFHYSAQFTVIDDYIYVRINNNDELINGNNYLYIKHKITLD